MRNPAAAVMADDRESAEAELSHDLDLILRHRALRIAGVIVAVGRLAAIAVAAQISRDDSEVASPVAGATNRHSRCVCGQPCRSNSGGPLPPITPWMLAPEVGCGGSRRRPAKHLSPGRSDAQPCTVRYPLARRSRQGGHRATPAGDSRLASAVGLRLTSRFRRAAYRSLRSSRAFSGASRSVQLLSRSIAATCVGELLVLDCAPQPLGDVPLRR